MRLSLYAAAAFLCASVAAHASPVTYTFTGTFTGTLGAHSFTSDQGTITLNGDTSGTADLGAGFYTNTSGISTISLDGIGTAAFLSPTFGAESQFDGAGFYDITSGFGVSLYDPTLGSYDLSFPFSDTGFFEESFGASGGTPELTSLGNLILSGDDGSSATFTATGTTPEPSSLALLGTGLLGVLGATRRRFAGTR